ncbi:MAG: hypothetical protein KC731_42480, partial [Myxococcales bacterium]|nr:hypothetical protein [Myxococcales bacterium]
MSATTTSRLATAEPTQALAPTGETPNVLWAMAWLAVLATLASRAVAPALPGVWVGVDHLITAAKLGAAITSQFFAVASTAVVMGLVLAT